jgi:hypothetical protein
MRNKYPFILYIFFVCKCKLVDFITTLEEGVGFLVALFEGMQRSLKSVQILVRFNKFACY